jgi:hypothetical protein
MLCRQHLEKRFFLQTIHKYNSKEQEFSNTALTWLKKVQIKLGKLIIGLFLLKHYSFDFERVFKENNKLKSFFLGNPVTKSRCTCRRKCKKTPCSTIVKICWRTTRGMLRSQRPCRRIYFDRDAAATSNNMYASTLCDRKEKTSEVFGYLNRVDLKPYEKAWCLT